MLVNAAASYSPDYQVIRFKSNFDVFSDPDNLRGFGTPHEVGFFVHEWIHFLHNVSTVHGICAYSHLAVTWSNARTFFFEDEGKIDAETAEQHRADMYKHLKFFRNARNAKLNDLADGLSRFDVVFVSCGVNTVLIGGDAKYKCSELVCEAEVKVGGEVFVKEVKIGCHELVESVAFMLEEKYLSLNKEAPIPSKVDPYHLLRCLSSFMSPNISSETLLRCALLSLQSIDPLESLPGLLVKAEAEAAKGGDPDVVISELAISHLHLCQKMLNETLDVIDGLFSVDEPMARAVKYSLGKMRSNYLYRMSDPFFEIGLIESFAKHGGAALGAAMEKFGVGFLIQERAGSRDKVERDLMYDLSLDDVRDSDLSAGRRVAQAAFSYILQFFNEGSDVLAHPEKMECPFYTCCDAVFRKENPESCKEKPWVAQGLDLDSMCFFGRAVINTKGEARIDSLSK